MVFCVCNVVVVAVVVLFGVHFSFFPLFSCRSRDVRADVFSGHSGQLVNSVRT